MVNGGGADAGDESGKRWWTNPAFIGGVITAVLGLVGTIITVAVRSDGGGKDPSPSVKVVEVKLDAKVRQFNVACPTTIVFDGTISAVGTGDVAYRFVYVNAFGGREISEEIRSVSFSSASTAAVRDEWVPSIPVGEVFRTSAIEIVSPVSLRSNEVTVTGICDVSLPPGPQTPPPDVNPPSG